MDTRALPNKLMTRPSSSGFTLLEVLIAFVILSLTLAAVFGAFSTGLQSLGTAEDAELAVLRAQSKLESAGLIEPLAASQASGDFADGAGWQVDIEPFNRRGTRPGATVRGQGERRLGKRPPRGVEKSEMVAGRMNGLARENQNVGSLRPVVGRPVVGARWLGRRSGGAPGGRLYPARSPGSA